MAVNSGAGASGPWSTSRSFTSWPSARSSSTVSSSAARFSGCSFVSGEGGSLLETAIRSACRLVSPLVDPPPRPRLRRPTERGQERARRDRGRARVRRPVGDRVVEQRAVAHRARQHAVDAPGRARRPGAAPAARARAGSSARTARSRPRGSGSSPRRRPPARRPPGRPRPPPRCRRSSHRALCCGCHGLRVTPQVGDSVQGTAPSSGMCVLPITIAPAARARRTISESSRAGSP